MKVIFSRKGFDSSYGGMASPILPDNRMLSLPIPENIKEAGVYDRRYEELCFEGKTYGDLLQSLKSKIAPTAFCHLDPDLYPEIIEWPMGWKALFGQESSAAGHLNNQGVEVGDIFLFFGWFKKTCNGAKGLPVWDKMDKQDKHVMFGYLEIGEIFKVDSEKELPVWMQRHPHADGNHRKQINNTIYVASDRLTLDGNFPGYGTFKFSDKVVLTKPGETRSCWQLPDFFRELKISYKPKWEKDYVRVAAKGQEFVVQGKESIALKKWVLDIIRTSFLQQRE